MKYISNRTRIASLIGIAAMMVLSACNKDLEQFKEANNTPTGLSIGETLTASDNDSLFNRMVIKGGMSAVLNDKSLTHTVFVPDNNAVIASFGGSLASANATIAFLPPATCAAIVKYNLVPQSLLSSQIVHNFPNLQMPTDIVLDPTNPLVRMTSFPSKNPSSGLFYYNNAPLTTVDTKVANGVIHHTAFVVAPPRRVLKDTINRDPNLTYFSAAVIRADSGQVGLNRFDSLLNYPVTNMTVLVPNNAAFQTVIFGIVYAKVLALTGGNVALATAQANAAVALGPAIFQVPQLFGDLPAADVRGILAYHLFGTLNPATSRFEPNIRVFSVNLPNTPTFVTTLVNNVLATHPGVMVNATFTGPFVSAATVNGVGTFPPGGAPFSDPPANVVGADRLAVNGIFHVIDKVLFPR